MTKIERIAHFLRILAEEDLHEDSEEGEETEANDELEILLWDSPIESDSPGDPTVDDQGYRGPHYTNRTIFRPLRVTLDNTKPPRGVKR